jgi:hypothetical protein
MKKGHSSKSNHVLKKKAALSIEEESDTVDLHAKGEDSVENIQENSRFMHLNEAKQSFLRELNDPRSKYLTPEEKLNSIILKAEKLASYLLTKHKFFEFFN